MGRKIFISMVLGVIFPLFAQQVTLTWVKGKRGEIDTIVPKGMTGYLICPFLNRDIICGLAVSLGDGKVEFKVYDALQNKAMALPVVVPKPGDKIIFQKDYRRVMIIAPDRESYYSLVNQYQEKGNSVIPSDVMAVFVEDNDEIPSRREFINFAKRLNIGRYIFLSDKGIEEIDALSLTPLRVLPWKGNGKVSYKVPFFTTYGDWEKIDEPILKRYKEEIFTFKPQS
ncbi:MAG: hypothetical protein C6I01_05975 [Epsilonproteobacteria bacterium]|nr:hypothetical protein [Campylobacterota bacterium]NPA89654.1 hypothetical protein [Campylobacterota bacterium]